MSFSINSLISSGNSIFSRNNYFSFLRWAILSHIIITKLKIIYANIKPHTIKLFECWSLVVSVVSALIQLKFIPIIPRSKASLTTEWKFQIQDLNGSVQQTQYIEKSCIKHNTHSVIYGVLGNIISKRQKKIFLVKTYQL